MHRKTDESARASLFPRRKEDESSTDGDSGDATDLENGEVSEDATDLENGVVSEDSPYAENGRRSKVTWLNGLVRRRRAQNA